MKEIICRCPCCGGYIMENSKSYFCSNWNAKDKCDFSVWKVMYGSPVTEDDVIDLSTRKMTFAKDFFRKDGTKYEGFLVLKADKTKRCGQSVGIKGTGR